MQYLSDIQGRTNCVGHLSKSQAFGGDPCLEIMILNDISYMPAQRDGFGEHVQAFYRSASKMIFIVLTDRPPLE